MGVVTKVKVTGVSGNMSYQTKSGQVIMTIDGVNRKVTIPSGSKLEMLGENVADIFFVDSTTGVDTKDGTSWTNAVKTIARAVALAAAGDTILIKGSFTEAVTVGKAGLSIIGAGTGPNMAIWTSATDTVSCAITAANVLIQNIKCRPPTYTAGVPAAISLSNAGYSKILGCRFQGQTGSWYAIYSAVCNSDNVEISDCEFIYMNTATYGTGVLGVEAGGLNYSGWKIRHNTFNSCLKAIDVSCRVAEITDNVIGEYGVNPAGSIAQLLAMGIDLSGTNSGGNMVTKNQLGGTYSSTLYVVGASGDQWAGNLNVLTGGVTAANPA